MTAEKKTEPGAKQSASTESTQARKAWVPKTPIDVILEQIKKQENRVAGLQQDLDKEKNLLTKLLQAKKILEAN